MQQARRTYWICWCAARCCQSYLQVGATPSPNTWRQGFNCHLGLYLVQVTSFLNMWRMTVKMIHNLVSLRTLQFRVPLGKVHVPQMVIFSLFYLAWIWTWISWLGFFQRSANAIRDFSNNQNFFWAPLCLLWILKVQTATAVMRASPIMLTIEPKVVNKFWTRSPISPELIMPFWCLFLESHLSRHHSNIGVWLR